LLQLPVDVDSHCPDALHDSLAEHPGAHVPPQPSSPQDRPAHSGVQPDVPASVGDTAHCDENHAQPRAQLPDTGPDALPSAQLADAAHQPQLAPAVHDAQSRAALQPDPPSLGGRREPTHSRDSHAHP
jgi:hypothetical protein